MAAWIRALTGDAPGARRALLKAERSALNKPLPGGSTSFPAAVAGVRALLAPNGIDGMLADAECAERLEPPGSRWHTPAALTLGVAKWLTGSPAEAARAFEQAVRFGRDAQRPEVACALAEHALMAADSGDWASADARAEQARSLVESAGLCEHVSALPVYAAVARVDLHRGDTRRTWHDAREALRLYQDPSPAAMPWMAVQAAVVLGRVFADLGDIASAQSMLTEARRHLTLLPTKGLLPATVEYLARLVESGLRREGVADATGLTKAELRVLELLPTHHTLGEIGDELRVSRNTIKTHVAAIYRKLDAATRAEAVRRAQGIGLLGA